MKKQKLYTETKANLIKAVALLLIWIAAVSILFNLGGFMLNGPDIDRELVETNTVESIDFTQKDSLSESSVYIETTTGTTVLAPNQITFVLAQNDEPFALDLYQYPESYWLHDNFIDQYTLHVPKGKLKEISKDYAEAYATTLETQSEE